MLYIAQYPVRRTTQIALHFTPWQLDFSGKRSSHAAITRGDYSLTFPPPSIAKYSFMQLRELGHRGENENAQCLAGYVSNKLPISFWHILFSFSYSSFTVQCIIIIDMYESWNKPIVICIVFLVIHSFTSSNHCLASLHQIWKYVEFVNDLADFDIEVSWSNIYATWTCSVDRLKVRLVKVLTGTWWHI